MAEEEITEQFSAYVDWVPPRSNGSLSNDDQGPLSFLGDNQEPLELPGRCSGAPWTMFGDL